MDTGGVPYNLHYRGVPLDDTLATDNRQLSTDN